MLLQQGVRRSVVHAKAVHHHARAAVDELVVAREKQLHENFNKLGSRGDEEENAAA